MNQPVELTGYIGMSDDSLFDENNVSITIGGGEYSFSSVSCSKSLSAPEVRELRKGMRVAVRGVVTSEEMGVQLSRCKFWSFSQDRWIAGGQRQTEQRGQAQQTNSTKSWQTSENDSQERSNSRTEVTEPRKAKHAFIPQQPRQ